MDTKKRKFLILYLDTGGGHKAPANVLKSVIESRYPGSEAVVVNGFTEKDVIPKLFFVDFYHASLNFFSSLYSFVYRFGNNYLFVRISHLFLQLFTIPNLRQMVKKEKPTDIINLHFALESAVRYMQRENPSIKAVNVVTDPFTVHSSWFYDKKAKYFVFSERVRQYAVKKCGILSENIKVVPFILNQKFLATLQSDNINAIKKKYGISLDKKVVLLAGGGEGLPIIKKIVKEFINRKADYTILAVCGRDKTVKSYLEKLSENALPFDLKVFGFINFMDELIKICDCALIKAGAASLMETLAARKPVVICEFIYGQELGNVQFAIDNGLGKFCRKPSDICDAVDYLVSDGKHSAALQKRLSTLPISFDTGKVADMLFNS